MLKKQDVDDEENKKGKAREKNDTKRNRREPIQTEEANRLN